MRSVSCFIPCYFVSLFYNSFVHITVNRKGDTKRWTGRHISERRWSLNAYYFDVSYLRIYNNADSKAQLPSLGPGVTGVIHNFQTTGWPVSRSPFCYYYNAFPAFVNTDFNRRGASPYSPLRERPTFTAPDRAQSVPRSEYHHTL